MEQRKYLPRAALSRIYYIDREVASGSYPNAEKLARGYETSLSTIHRDIDYMRNSLNAPIEYDHFKRGYYYAVKAFRLPARFASAEDMLALGMVKSVLQLYKDTPLYESAKRLLDEITAPLTRNDSGSDTKNRWYETRFIVPPVASAPVDDELWQVITDAIRDNHLITFDYQNMKEDRYKARLVRPYQMLLNNGMWYLYGYSEDKAGLRTFSLSRMKNPRLTNETFNLPPDYDFFSKHDSSSFGVYIGKKSGYRIWFAPEAARFIEERQWAGDQRIEKSPDGDGIVLSFTSSELVKVLYWVLSYGGRAVPLEPPELVTQWKENVETMRNKFAKTEPGN